MAKALLYNTSSGNRINANSTATTILNVNFTGENPGLTFAIQNLTERSGF
jgi:hypothetical protein